MLMHTEEPEPTYDPDRRSAEDIYSREVRRIPMQTREERMAMGLNLPTIEDRNLFCERNLRLVFKLADKYWFLNKDRLNGMSREDLIQEGNIGLLKAIERFDPTRNIQFGTYAFHWIRQAIVRALHNTADLIRLPVHKKEEIWAYKRMWKKLFTRSECDPTTEEIAEHMNIPVDRAVEIEVMIQINETESLDEILECNEENEDDWHTYEPLAIADHARANPLEMLLQEERLEMGKQAVREWHQKLLACPIRATAKIAYAMRKGLDGTNREKTFQEIGSTLGLTRSRIQQLVKEAAVAMREYRPRNKQVES